MIFTLTDRSYNILDIYICEEYLIGKYINSIIKTLSIDVFITSENADQWVDGNYIMCQDSKGLNYWFTIYSVEDSLYSDTKTLTCYSGTIDILGEDANPIRRPSTPQPFEWYFNKIFYDTGITIGINEVSTLTRTLEFTSDNVSNVEMMHYVLKGFDNAEAELEVIFEGSIPIALVLNIYRRIGDPLPQTLLTDDDSSLTKLSRKSSILNLATCINPEGVNEEDSEKPITLVGKYYDEKDEDGNIMYYSPIDSPRIFSVIARENYFVELPGKTNGEFEGYITRMYKSQAVTQDSLWREALLQLKNIDHAEIEYATSGTIDCELGDAIYIESRTMKPRILVTARVVEYKFNDDDPSKNEYVFSNYVE